MRILYQAVVAALVAAEAEGLLQAATVQLVELEDLEAEEERVQRQLVLEVLEQERHQLEAAEEEELDLVELCFSILEP